MERCCPTCKREFRQASDYPFIQVTDSERFSLPEVVFGSLYFQEFLHFNELPWSVQRRFKRENIRRTEYMEHVYQVMESHDLDVMSLPLKHRTFQCGNNLREEALKALDNEGLKSFLESLEKSVGSTIELPEILRRTYMKEGYRSTFTFLDEEKKQESELTFDDNGLINNHGNFYIHLVGFANVINSCAKERLYFRRVPLIKIGYEGRLEI